jgi:hypothetical protein
MNCRARSVINLSWPSAGPSYPQVTACTQCPDPALMNSAAVEVYRLGIQFICGSGAFNDLM